MVSRSVRALGFLVLALHFCNQAFSPVTAWANPAAKDLLPVKEHPAPKHAPLVIVDKGVAKAQLAILGPVGGSMSQATANMVEFIEKATGAKLEVVSDPAKVVPPAIIVGDCELAQKHGIDAKQMPIDGFTIKTTPEYVFIVGHDETLRGGGISEGTAFGMFEFLERFVGARWYFPTELGQSIPKLESLRVPPVHLTDEPAFRMRVVWPPMSNPNNGTGTPLAPVQNFNRAGNSWTVQLRVHQPNWATVEEYMKERPEIFQLRSDGTRDHFMICYGNPKTLATYLENIERNYKGETPVHLGIVDDAITVSPNDAEVACYCEHCRKLWNEDGGQWGSASKIVGKFVADLATEVKTRWPGKTVIYLPYLNYTAAPEGVVFPDNVEVQLCGMPGMAMYKEPEVLALDQANIDAWMKMTNRKIQNWHYSCWPANKTDAPYLYPHIAQKFYRANREKTIGTFINGETDHWHRHHLALYCWQRAMWNPEFNVDAAIEEYCTRMYGPAAATMRELVKNQIEAWEDSRWSGGRISPKAIHEISFPPARIEVMQKLITQAREEVKSDPQAVARLEYYVGPFAEFFKHSQEYHSGGGMKALVMQKVGENPKIDGQLTDAVWDRAEANYFVRGWDEKQKEPTYSTTVRGVWTTDGVTFGFRMSEPTPDVIERKIKGADDSMAWWDDNVELLFDVTGKNEGSFYQFIINPNNAVADAKENDFSWNLEGMKAAAFVGQDFWSLEVYYPYKSFPQAAVPGSGTNTVWTGNFTRHRVADMGLKQTLQPRQGSQREYQRMNTTYAKPSNNLQDFAPLKFVE
jgi:hypothetical protein